MEVFEEYVNKLVNAKLTVSTGKVTEVNGTTCKVERKNLPPLLDVRLQAIEGDFDSHLLIIPKVGSVVACMSVDGEIAETCIVKYTAIESITLFNDAFGGLVKVEPLTEKINRLENKLNDLITKFNGHTHITTATIGSGPAVGVIAPPTSKETKIQPITDRKDIESETVKHGG